MCGTGKVCHECPEGPCGPGGDFMKGGISYTRCSNCGEDFYYGTSCKKCKKDGVEVRNIFGMLIKNS